MSERDLLAEHTRINELIEWDRDTNQTFLLKEEVTVFQQCRLGPTQVIVQRRRRAARDSELDELQRDIERRETDLKRDKKRLEFELARSAQENRDLNRMPPEGSFEFTGRLVGSNKPHGDQRRCCWIEDADGNPIPETYREMSDKQLAELTECADRREESRQVDLMDVIESRTASPAEPDSQPETEEALPDDVDDEGSFEEEETAVEAQTSALKPGRARKAG